MRMHVSLCIVTWNDAGHLSDVFASIRAQTYSESTVRIFDDGSADGETVPFILREEPHWLAARSTKHVGRAVSNNQLVKLALERHKGDPAKHAVLFADSSTVWHPDMIEILVRALESDQAIHAVQPKIFRAFSERGEADVDTVQSDILDSTGGVLMPGYWLQERGAGEMDRGQFDVGFERILPTPGVFLIRADALHRLAFEGKVFDEALKLGDDGADFALRFARLGFTARYIPEACAHRYRGFAVAPVHSLWVRIAHWRLFRTPSNSLALPNHWVLLWKQMSFIDALHYAPRFLFVDVPRAIFFAIFDSRTRRGLLALPKILFTTRAARKFGRKQAVISLRAVRRFFAAS